MSERLPELLDAKGLQIELGVTRATAEAIMRRLPIVQPDCIRKVFVKRSDVAAYIDAMTFSKHYSPHDLRHRRLTLWHQAGVPARELAERAGHSKPSMSLDVYTHVMPVAEIDDSRLASVLVRDV